LEWVSRRLALFYHKARSFFRSLTFVIAVVVEVADSTVVGGKRCLAVHAIRKPRRLEGGARHAHNLGDSIAVKQVVIVVVVVVVVVVAAVAAAVAVAGHREEMACLCA